MSDLLTEDISKYRIGAKARALRLGKNLSLSELGEHTGLSAGMLSKIETGQVIPTLPTLLRISQVFGVGLDHFFNHGDRPVLEITRARDRLKLPDTTERMPTYYFESLDYPANDRPIDSFLSEFMPRTPASEPHEHEGFELIYVISGALELCIHDQHHTLKAGDSIYFDGRYLHTYRCGSETPATAIIVATRAPFGLMPKA